jgi:hypothetical protein
MFSSCLDSCFCQCISKCFPLVSIVVSVSAYLNFQYDIHIKATERRYEDKDGNKEPVLAATVIMLKLCPYWYLAIITSESAVPSRPNTFPQKSLVTVLPNKYVGSAVVFDVISCCEMSIMSRYSDVTLWDTLQWHYSLKSYSDITLRDIFLWHRIMSFYTDVVMWYVTTMQSNEICSDDAMLSKMLRWHDVTEIFAIALFNSVLSCPVVFRKLNADLFTELRDVVLLCVVIAVVS